MLNQRVKFRINYTGHEGVIRDKIIVCNNSCGTTAYIIVLDDGRIVTVAPHNLISIVQ